MNPFTFYKAPASRLERQANANWATYERMAACADLAEYDQAKVRAPCEVISRAHTAKWVEKEYARQARKD